MAYTYFQIPDPRAGQVSPQTIRAAKAQSLIPSEVAAYATWEDRLQSIWMAPESEGDSFKGWRWNPAITTGLAAGPYFYVALARTATGAIRAIDLTAAGWDSDETWRFANPGVVQFYRSHPGVYPLVPALAFYTAGNSPDDREAVRMNFGKDLAGRSVALPDPPVDYPLGSFLHDPTGPCRIAYFDGHWHCGQSGDFADKGVPEGSLNFQARCTFRSDYALRFNSAGQPEAFRYIV